ncbi:sensor histidine kinase [Gemmobacter sp. 24YEA27]|uniref:sensor histidine kinase n=1 Tax=Gemmobacter sp. 24YEA27 TaxID=3040672 RepID=UPI0024B363CF|nr:sensor histidine kinase [Gemmobacter sp. 24YEA27]
MAASLKHMEWSGSVNTFRACAGRWLGTVLVIFLIFVSAGTAGADMVPGAPLSLEGRVAMLRDSTGQLSLTDVLERQDSFVPTKPTASFGYTSDAIWLRLEITAKERKRAVLSLQPNYLDLVDFYIAEERGGLRATDFALWKGGDHRPIQEDGISGLMDAVRLDLKPDRATVVLIRIENRNSSTQVDLRLHPEQNHIIFVTTSALIYGLWFGGMAIMVMIQFVFLYYDRKPQYFWLAMATFGVSMIYFGNLGISRVYLFPGNGRANDFFIGFNAWIGMTISVVSCISIMDIMRKSIFLRIAYAIPAMLGLVGGLFSALGMNLVFGPIGSLAALAIAILNMCVAIYYRNEDGFAGKMRATAYSLTGIGVSMALMQRLGAPLLPNFVMHAYGIAVLGQMLLLTGAMAVRMRDMESRNRMIRQRELETAKTAEKKAADLVEERTEELASAKRVAEEALQAELESQRQKISFFEAVSHQYRTPLAVIRATVDAIGISLPTEDDINKERITRVRRAISRLVDILEVNLVRSRVQGASFQAELEAHSVRNLIAAGTGRAMELMPNAQLELIVDTDTEDALIMADLEMFEIALVSVIENSTKYASDERSSEIALTTRLEGDEIVISIKDKGIGIPEDEISRIFGNGYRGGSAINIEGSGLGLFLVDRIIASHSGTVTAESKVGTGTTISFRLPQAPSV